MGLIVFHGIFPDISHIQFECGKYLGVFCGIVSIPHNIVMNLDNVMQEHNTPKVYGFLKDTFFDYSTSPRI